MARDNYWVPIPAIEIEGELPGKLIVLEGTDGVGRSTQITMLRRWMESSGLAVAETGLRRGSLAGNDIQRAKEGHTMSRRTQTLFYATDFADRLENEIIPPLRAGFVVLTDRYIYSLMARAAVRGLDREWLRKLYGFALKPDLVLYLQASIDKLIPRVLTSGGFDYWESGMDYQSQSNLYDAFIKHQANLLSEFGELARDYDFAQVDADRSARDVFGEIQQKVAAVIEGLTPQEVPFSEFPTDRMPSDRDVPGRSGSVLEKMRDMLLSLMDDE